MSPGRRTPRRRKRERPIPDLILVRHAPTSWSGRRYCGRADPPLTRAGTTVARRLAADLVSTVVPGLVGIDGRAIRIVCSPARRARQTARAIAHVVPGARVEIDDRWAEADVGFAEGRTFDELRAMAPELAARLLSGDPAIDWPGGESASALAERVSAAWLDLCQATVTTIVVSHAGPLRIAVGLASDLPIESVPFLEPGAFVHLPSPGGSGVDPGRMLRFRL